MTRRVRERPLLQLDEAPHGALGAAALAGLGDRSSRGMRNYRNTLLIGGMEKLSHRVEQSMERLEGAGGGFDS